MSTESELTAADGTPLLMRDWSPEGAKAPRCLLLIVHGVGEHCGRYQHIAAALTEEGYAVRAFDHRGHGLSGGLRGHVDGFHHYSGDLNLVLNDWRAKHGEEIPCFLLGHSMGGLVVLHFLGQHQDAKVAGAVLSNPCLELAVQAPRLKVAAGKILSRLLPTLRLDNELDTSRLTRDLNAVEAYEKDPLVHRKISTRWYTSLVAAMEHVNSSGIDSSLPTLWLVGGSDSICAPSGSRRFAGQQNSSHTTLREWPDALHEVHNGPDKGEYLAALRAWLSAQCREASP